jgi:hypothetical protein
MASPSNPVRFFLLERIEMDEVLFWGTEKVKKGFIPIYEPVKRQ